MVKHTKLIHSKCSSEFDHFVGLALKRLSLYITLILSIFLNDEDILSIFASSTLFLNVNLET